MGCCDKWMQTSRVTFQNPEWCTPNQMERVCVCGGGGGHLGPRGGNSAVNLPRCVNMKVMDMGQFLAPSE